MNARVVNIQLFNCIDYSLLIGALHFYEEFVEGTARITEARLNRERSEGNIIDYQRIKDSGYKVIQRDAFNSREHKVV